jgi:hypothetical protein
MKPKQLSSGNPKMSMAHDHVRSHRREPVRNHAIMPENRAAIDRGTTSSRLRGWMVWIGGHLGDRSTFDGSPHDRLEAVEFA